MGRAPCCEKSGLKKGPWTPEEDHKLIDYISKNGYGNWRTLPMNAGLERCGKSCRLRWTNYLRPDIKRGRFSLEEEENIIQLHSVLGNKWSAIAGRLPGRTDNEIKNYWNTHIRKKLVRMGIDPVTHSPRLDLFDQLSSISCLYHQYNNQTSSSRLMMDMDDQSSSPVTYTNSLMSSSQPDNLLQLATNLIYPQTSTLSSDPTRMIFQNQYYYDDTTQHELIDHQDQSLIQIQAFQKQAAEYEHSVRFQSKVSTLANLSHVDSDYVPIPFTDFYSGLNQNQILNNSVVQNLSMNNSVISTPSSSPNSNVYMNNSCISTEADEKEIHNNRIDYFNNDLVKMIKFEIPDHQIFDINEFMIYS